MTRGKRLETSVYWLLIALTVVMMAMVTRDAWNRIGQPTPGFAVLENMLVGVGGVDRGGLQPFDVVRAVNGRLVASTRDLQAEVERHPPGTPMHYLLVRNGQLVEDDIPSRVSTLRNFKRFLIENMRSEEHTSELQSPCKIVCRLPHENKHTDQAPTLTRAQ